MPERFAVWQAVAWTVAATAGLALALTWGTAGFRQRGAILPLRLTPVGVYGLAVILFASAQKMPTSELLALRAVPLRSCLVAAALGVALQFPCTLLANLVDKLYPLPEDVLKHRLALITPHSTVHGVAIV